MKPGLLLVLFFVSALTTIAQDFSKSMHNAFLIARMVEKFHLQPRPLDDGLSNDLFSQFIKAADPDRLIFSVSDINDLGVYRNMLDEEIMHRGTAFLKKATVAWQKGMRQNDSLLQTISKQAFDFSIAEKYALAEDTAYIINTGSRQNKLYKHTKWQMLEAITEMSAQFEGKSPALQKQFVDSCEAGLRKEAYAAFQKGYAELAEPEKAGAVLGDLFCKALAHCYDPHTTFMPAQEKEAFDEDLGQKPLRFGIALDQNEAGDIIIANLQPGSSAFKSGILNAGDKLMTWQETGKPAMDVKGSGYKKLDSLFNETKSDKILLTVKKPDGITKQVTLYKERFSTEEDEENKVQGYILKGEKNVGYIAIPDFYIDWEDTQTGIYGCANDVAKEIIKLKKENIEGLIIDIRYNGGGSVKEAVELSGIFIDGGPVAQYKQKEQKVLTLKDVNAGSIFSGPLLIMVNGYSASASELFSAALQDYNRAVIAGTPTYGKATGQVVFPLDTTVTTETLHSSNAEHFIKITGSALYRVNGTTAQQEGVIPDIILPDLLQTVGTKEKDEKFAFRLAPVESNKYYKPYPPVRKEELKAIAQTVTDTSSYFKMLKNYELQIKGLMQQSEISLKMEDMLRYKKERQSWLDTLEAYRPHAFFTVANHVMRTERLKTSEWLTEMDNETRASLASDAYIGICYLLLVKMIPG
ncbi:S41 family peptidase [Agriterribacter sp.]|uniref:S41 family peptidase n=1 Tax=Agriterribacter sp. TaxID=2821509 RepID=UPI002CE30A8A|nr:S41 family peptidase [Agriterribacter sp.]HRO48113.1 S41 family peptidase [Agriterribacter sp.]HRQ17963.1 S41 family peptidase [Agriterribacter sp.]